MSSQFANDHLALNSATICENNRRFHTLWGVYYYLDAVSPAPGNDVKGQENSMASHQTNFQRTVDAMSASDMELLIRAYINKHVHPTSEKYGGSVQFQLTGSVPGGKDAVEGVKWAMSGNYENSTKGEILAVTAKEFYRRVGWSDSSVASLLLIEGFTEAEPPAEVEPIGPVPS